MHFELTDEQKGIKETVRKFIARECPREKVQKLDERGEFPREMLARIGEMGFCGLVIPEEYGGGGRNVVGAVIVVEELSAIYPALAGAFIGSAFCGGKNLAELGSEGQKEKYLPGLAEGSLLFSYGLSGPKGNCSGPDAGTRARQNGSGFLLEGTKLFVRLAERSDCFLVSARTVQNGTEQGLSLFIVDSRSQGVRLEEMEKLGNRGLRLWAVHFDRVRVPQENVLGGPEGLHQGEGQLQAVLESENLETAACALGIAQGAYSYAAGYAKERVQFERPIIRFEAVLHMLVDAAVDIEAGRFLTYRAGWLAEQGRRSLREAALARAYTSEAARKASLNCLQILGGYGYTMEYDAQRYLRDSLVLLNGCQNAETLKNFLGSLLELV